MVTGLVFALKNNHPHVIALTVPTTTASAGGEIFLLWNLEAISEPSYRY